MKTLLVLLFALIGYANAQVNTYDAVFEKSMRATTGQTLTDYFQIGALDSDTLAFVIEVDSADSLDAANPLSGDSLAITVKMLPQSPGGFTDTTTVTYWTTVVSKTATQGRVSFGTGIPLGPAKIFGARGYITVTNTTGGTQSFKLRVWKIRKYVNRR